MIRERATMRFKAKGLRRLFGRTYKKRVWFRFTNFAWFYASDLAGINLSEFDSLDIKETQLLILYGAAKYEAMKNDKPLGFTVEEFKEAFQETPAKEGEKLGKAMAESMDEKWLDQYKEEEDDELVKKK